MASTVKKVGRYINPKGITRRKYHSSSTKKLTDSAYVVDLRSDVLTKPSEKMKQRMMEASAGDDVMNEDKCVHELQDTMTKMFGKEAALFVPSGTMGNFMSVLCQSSHAKGLEVLLGDKSHIVMYEQGGLATLGGVHTRSVPTNNDGTFDLDTLEEYIRPQNDPHQPWTAVIGIENTHNCFGGKVLPLNYVSKLKSMIKDTDIKLHMDGARVMNAAVALDLPPKQILKDVDSVSVCLSKGVGTPIGSVMAGSKDMIQRAVRMRKMLGGGWRQPGMLAAAGLCALEDVVPRMKQDHKHAKMLANAIMENHHNVVHVDIPGVHTNIVMIDITKPNVTAKEFCERLEIVTEDEYKQIGEKIIIKSFPFFKQVARFVTYTGIDDTHIRNATRKISYVLEEMASDSCTRKETDSVINITSSVQKKKETTKYPEWEPLLYNLSYRKEITT